MSLEKTALLFTTICLCIGLVAETALSSSPSGSGSFAAIFCNLVAAFCVVASAYAFAVTFGFCAACSTNFSAVQRSARQSASRAAQALH